METAVRLVQMLRQLRLTTVAQTYGQLATDAAQANWGYERFLLALAEQELAHREQQRCQHYVKQAHFPVLKELADFDFAAIPQLNRARILALAQGGYIPKAETVILIGNPGLGKTHIATALGVRACRQGQRVQFYTAAGLVNELLQAQETHRLARVLERACKQQVIVLDELGFLPLSTTGAQLLFQFCSALHERVSLIVTTNLRFADWPQVFGNASLTAALLDRLTARAHILEFVGESFRLRQRTRREQAGWLTEVESPLTAAAGSPAAGSPAAGSPAAVSGPSETGSLLADQVAPI